MHLMKTKPKHINSCKVTSIHHTQRIPKKNVNQEKINRLIRNKIQNTKKKTEQLIAKIGWALIKNY